MSRAYTRQEVKEMFLDHLDMMVDEWTRSGLKSGSSRHENLTSLVFSILALIDGVSAGFPAIDLLLDPHEDDGAYCQKNDENWFEPNMSIPEGDYLHDEWYSDARKARRAGMERMLANRFASREKTPFLVRVRTVTELHGSFTEEAQKTRRADTAGALVGVVAYHGPCFVVRHDDGTTGAYEAEELMLINPEAR